VSHDYGNVTVIANLNVVALNREVGLAILHELQPLGSIQYTASEIRLDVVSCREPIERCNVLPRVCIPGFARQPREFCSVCSSISNRTAEALVWLTEESGNDGCNERNNLIIRNFDCVLGWPNEK